MGIEHTTETSSWLWTGGHYDSEPMPRFCPQAIGMRSFPAKGAQLPTTKTMNLTDWQLRDTQVSARGAKSAQCRATDGSKVHFTLGSVSDPCQTPFGASSFGNEETHRKTLELTIDDEKSWEAFDTHWCEYLAKHSFRLFKKIMTVEEVRASYKSPVSKKGDYKALLRCKVNTDGAYACRVWDENRQRIPMPEDLRELDIQARIQASHLWCMSREFGFVFQVTDLQLRGGSTECPFEEESGGAFGGA